MTQNFISNKQFFFVTESLYFTMTEHSPSVLTGEFPALGVLDIAGVFPAIWTADTAEPSFDSGPGRGQGDVPGRFVSGAQRRQESTDELDFVALGGGAAAR